MEICFQLVCCFLFQAEEHVVGRDIGGIAANGQYVLELDLVYCIFSLALKYPDLKIWCLQHILIYIWLMFCFSFMGSNSSFCCMKFWSLQNILRVCMAISQARWSSSFWILMLETWLFLSPLNLQGKTEEGKRRAKRCKKNQTIKWCRLRLWRWSWFALVKTAARQVFPLMSSLSRTSFFF